MVYICRKNNMENENDKLNYLEKPTIITLQMTASDYRALESIKFYFEKEQNNLSQLAVDALERIIKSQIKDKII